MDNLLEQVGRLSWAGWAWTVLCFVSGSANFGSPISNLSIEPSVQRHQDCLQCLLSSPSRCPWAPHVSRQQPGRGLQLRPRNAYHGRTRHAQDLRTRGAHPAK